MKSFKKHILLFIFILIGMFFIKIENVKAANIDWKGVVIECVYSDGSLFEYSYNDYTGKWATNKYTYNLKGADSVSNTSSSTLVYSQTNGTPIYTPDTRRGSAAYKRCYPYLTKSIVSDKGDDSEGQTTTYLKFTSFSDVAFDDADFSETWKDYFWWWQKPTSDRANKVRDTYGLVSENYILTDKAGQPDAVYNYKQEEEKAEGEVTQAISKPQYITILKYGSLILAQSQNKTNAITTSSKPAVLYFSDADPKSYSGNNGTMSYYFNDIRTTEKSESAYKALSSSEKSKYRRFVFNGDGLAPEDLDTGELCTKIMPQTSKDLAKIIGIVQLVVPVLLILLIGLDIGKLVIAGNLDEELPKQKTKIIVRFVSALVIFFLPLILQILLSTVKVDSGSTEDEISAIQSIKCIIDMVGRV